MNAAGGVVAEVGMRGEVRAVASGFAFVVYLANESTAHEGFEAVIDRCKGEAGHGFAGTLKNFVDGRVIAFGEEYGVDDFALGGDFLTAVGEGFLESFSLMFSQILNHSKHQLSWNDSKLQEKGANAIGIRGF